MNYEIYKLYNSDNEFIYNVAITGDIVSLFKFKKENNFKYNYLDTFKLEETDLEKINDDLAKVIKKIEI